MVKKMAPEEAREILDLPMQENDAKAATIRDYLRTLLRKVVAEGECFSGKRPFGNSGWEHALYVPLVKARKIKGSLDEDGFLDDCDDEKGRRLILAAIDADRPT